MPSGLAVGRLLLYGDRRSIVARTSCRAHEHTIAPRGGPAPSTGRSPYTLYFFCNLCVLLCADPIERCGVSYRVLRGDHSVQDPPYTQKPVLPYILLFISSLFSVLIALFLRDSLTIFIYIPRR